MRRVILFVGAIALCVCASARTWADSAPQAGVVDAAGTPYEEVDCGASIMSRATTEAETLLRAHIAPQPMSTTSCKRVGKGALAYCAGGCEYTHLSCSEVVTSSGFICQCK